MALVASAPPSITPYPLCWPVGWPRTTRRAPMKLRASLRVVREHLLEVLYRLGAKEVVISSDLPVNNRLGLPLERPDDPGVAVYFQLLGGYWVLPCDHWESVRANMQGISQTLEALETIAQAGIHGGLSRALQGFTLPLEEPLRVPLERPSRRPLLRRRPLTETLESAALTPAPTDDTAGAVEASPWLRLLGLQPEFSREQLEEAYWYLRHAYHPDRGGDAEIFQGLQDARRRAMQYLRERGAAAPHDS